MENKIGNLIYNWKYCMKFILYIYFMVYKVNFQWVFLIGRGVCIRNSGQEDGSESEISKGGSGGERVVFSREVEIVRKFIMDYVYFRYCNFVEVLEL